MHRRFLIPLAAGVVGLLAISPVLAADSDAPDKKSPPSEATSSTAAESDDSSDPDTSADSGDPDSGSSDSGSSDSGDSDSGAGRSDDDQSADGGADDGSSGNNSGSRTGSDSGTGSGSSGGQRSSSVCDPPVTDRTPAPQMGEDAQTHEAGEAGTVDVERLSDTELRIAGAKANDGWTEQIAHASGPRVTVKFTRQGESPSLIRFAAQMDQRGTMLHIRVTSCG